MCRWNLMKLAEALDPLLPLAVGRQIVADVFDTTYLTAYSNTFAKKLGLGSSSNNNGDIISSLFDAMEDTRSDFTGNITC